MQTDETTLPPDLWRPRFLARLTGERAGLFQALVGLDETTLTGPPVFEDWRAGELLAHIGRWDAFHTRRMTLLADGRGDEIISIELDQLNAGWHEAFRQMSLELSLAICLKERAGFLAALNRLSDEALVADYHFPWGAPASIRRLAVWRCGHDATHAADLRRWREALPAATTAAGLGPKFILRAFMRAVRKEFAALVALVPADDRLDRPIHEEWTLKALVGHIADWDRLLVEALEQVVEHGRVTGLDYDGDFEAFNARHAAARRGQPWEAVWDDFIRLRRTAVELVDRIPAATLGQTFDAPWGPENSAYKYVRVWLEHEREHAAGLREALGLPALGEHLLL